MAVGLSIDTSFLVDLQRESARRRSGPAHQFLERHRQSELSISAVAVGEFREGFPAGDHPAFRAIVSRLVLLPIDEPTALLYGEVARDLRARGGLIGSNDLWIGVSALRWGRPLVTSNVDHFSRVSGLQVLDHRAH